MTVNIIDPIAIVRECKGPALAILWLLLVVKRPVSQEWLERHTGYTDKPVSQALEYLRETQRIDRNHAGWVLREGIQLSLPILSESRNNSDSINNDSIYFKEEERSLIIDGENPTLTALRSCGIAINDKTRPLLALSPSDIEKGVRNAAKKGHGRNTSYIIGCLLSLLAAPEKGNQRYSDWEK